MNLLETFKNYLFSLKHPASKVTVKNYLADIRKFISWIEAQSHTPFNPKTISIQQITEFKNAQLSNSPRSVERYISSLRKFFDFLKLEGHIAVSPFENEAVKNEKPHDPWHLKDFKNFLYVYNASSLTIKNYIIDVRQFLSWAKEVLQVTDEEILSQITTETVEAYKERLFSEKVFSAASINRKLSSLRKYLSWAGQQHFLTGNIATKSQQISADIVIEKAEHVEFVPEKTDHLLHEEKIQYSSFPPLRMVQKAFHALLFLIENLVVTPLTSVLERGLYSIWKIKGKKLFRVVNKSQEFRSPVKISQFSNVPKAVFAPLSISLAGLPFYKKAWIYLRFKRPKWYKKYHEYAISHYFHWGVLFVFTAIIGFGLYASFVKSSSPTLAAAASPLRILSFQGRLTDSSDNPITSGKNIRFIIYNDSSASGSARLWEEVRYVTPDTDGIFQVLLGSDGAANGGNASLCNGGNPPSSPASGFCGIPQSLFANNAQLFMGVTIESTSELTPRQQIATVPYATNAEVLQGMPPTTDSGVTTNTNAVLALDSSGVVSISGNSTATTIQYTGNQFNLIGKVLSLQTASGTNTNVQISPDGRGVIDVQKPLQNSTLNSNLVSGSNGVHTAAGAVEVNDLFGVLATSSGQSAFTVNQDGLGPVISASKSGLPIFTVDGSGNGTFAGNIVGININGTNLSISGNVTSNLIPTPSNNYSLGDSLHQWLNIYGANFYSNGALLSSFWNQQNGALYPGISSVDLLIGGTSTDSAKFAFINNLTGTPTASISANSGNNAVYITGDGTLARTNRGTLTLGNSSTYNTTGDVVINPNGTGNAGIGVTTPATLFEIASSKNAVSNLSTASNYNLYIRDVNSTDGQGTGIAFAVSNNSGTPSVGASIVHIRSGSASFGDLTFNTRPSGGNVTERLRITSTGSVGIGASSPLATLDVRANDYTTPVASISGATGKATLVLDQTGVGDIIAASVSGQSRFYVTNGGNLVAKQFVDLDNNSYFLDPAATTTSLILAGTQGIGTTNPLSQTGLDIEKNGLGNAVLVANQSGNGDILTASSSGTSKFTVRNTGAIQSGFYTTAGGIFYADSTGVFTQTVAGGSGQCLTSTGGGTPAWATCSTGGAGTNYWTIAPSGGALTPINSTLDLLVGGGQATSSAKFAILNVNSGTPVASVSAQNATNQALVLGSDETIQTVRMHNLTIGGSSTGNITLKPLNGTNGTITFSGYGNGIIRSTSGLLSASTVSLTNGSADITGILGTDNGGTGIATGSYTAGDLPYYASGTSLSRLGIGAANTVLTSSGTAPQWSTSLTLAGNLTVNGNTTIGDATSDTLTITALLNQALIPTGGGTINLGSSTNPYNNVYANNFIGQGTSGTFGFWTLSNNIIYPTATYYDLAVGGTSTGSATPWQVFSSSVGVATAGTATSSGNLTFRGTSTDIKLLNGGSLNIKSSVGGDASTTTIFALSNQGAITLGGTNPSITASATNSTLALAANGTGNLNLNFGATGAIQFFSASNKIDNSGNLTLAGTITLPNSNTLTGAAGTVQFTNGILVNSGGAAGIKTTIDTSGNILPGQDGSANIGSAALNWGTGYFKNLVLPSTGGTAGYWTFNNDVLYPTYASVTDLAVGGTGTSSALFQIFANTINTQPAGTASTSGNLSFRGVSSQFNLLNGAGLNIKQSVGGDAGLVSALFISTPKSNSAPGFIGINNSSPLEQLDVIGNASVSGNLTFYGGSRTIAARQLQNLILGDSQTGILYHNPSTASVFGSSTVIPLSQTAVQISKNGLGNSVLVVDQTGSGDILTASASGVAKFTIANDGTVKNNWIPNLDITYNLGSPSLRWNNLYVNNVFASAADGTNGFWQRNSNVIAPAYIWNDLAIGGTATGSATPWQVFGSSVGVAVAGTATSSGNLTFRNGLRKVSLLDGSSLGFYTSLGGDTGLSNIPSLFIATASASNTRGNVGIGTINPLALLDIAGNASMSGNLSFAGGVRTIAATALNNLIIGDANTGNLYFNPSIASIFGSSTTLAPLSQTALQVSKNGLGNSIAVIDQLGNGDIFTASASGTPEFKITAAGNAHARQFVDLDNGNYFLDPASTITSLATAGSAGIATTSATQTLTVLGDAQIGKDNINWGSSLTAYGFRKQIFLQNNAASPSGTLSNYQQRIVINTAALISASKMRSDCADIRFTDEDGTTNLPYWLEAGCNTGETTFWVKVPTIPGGQQKLIYMYYSNGGASSASTTSIVTDTISSVKASWRMDDYDPSSLNDSSGNLNYASTSANVITVNGKFNYAKQFNGSSSYYEVADSTSLRLTNTYSISVWFKTTQTSTGTILRKDYNGTGTRFLYAIRVNDTTTCAANKVEFQFFNGGGPTNSYACSTSNANDGQWHHVVAIMDAANKMSLYFDGVQEAAPGSALTTGAPTGSLDIGAIPVIPGGARTDFFTGTIDDIIITNTALSSSQVASLYGATTPPTNNGKNIGYMSAYPATAGDLYVMGYAQNPPVPVFMQEENVTRILPSFYVQATTGNIGIGTNQVASSSARLTVAGDVKAGLYDVTTWGSNFNTYQFRSKITVDNTASSSSMTNYQAQVNVNTAALISAGKMRVDCGDMRFTDSDGNTALNYWIETASGSATLCNTTSTTTWVKIPSIQGSAKKFIYMYYGNPTASTTSNGTNTFDFFDDFTTFDTATTWSKTGSAFLTNGNTALAINTGAVYTQATKFSQPGEVLEAKVLWKNSVNNQGITMTSNQSCAGGNVVCSTYLQTGGTAIGLWANNNNSSVWNTSNAQTQFTSILNTSYIIGEAVAKNQLFTYLNRTSLNNYAANVQNANYSATQYIVLGLNSGSAAGATDVSDAFYEWVIARQFSPNPPTITIGTEQDPSQVDPVIYASTVTQNVGINTANPTATLELAGTNSNTNGMVYIGGTNLVPAHALTVATTFTQLSNTVTLAGLESAPVFNPISAWNMLGGGLAGFRAEPSFTGTGTMGSLFGFNDLPANNNVGTVTNMFGNYIQLRNNSTGTISNAYGTYIAAPTNNGTITTKYSLYTETGAGNVSIGDSLFVTSKIGVGVSSANRSLHIEDAAAGQIQLRNTSAASGRFWYIGPDTSGSNFVVFNENATGMYIAYGTTFWTPNVSDQRFKTNVEPLAAKNKGIEAIKKLRPVTYNWIDTNSPTNLQYGLIAQEVQPYFPELVFQSSPQTIHYRDGHQETYDSPLTVGYSGFIPYILQGLIDLDASNSATLEQVKDLYKFDLAYTGDIAVSPTINQTNFSTPHYFTIADGIGQAINRMQAFAELVVGNLRVGGISAQEIATNQFAVATENITIAGQSLQNYIITTIQTAINNGTIGQWNNGQVISPLAVTDHLKTNIISPLADDAAIAVKLDKDKISIFNDKDASHSAVASIDNIGNATFSGTLNSDKLAVNTDATVGGTLKAHRIEADEIVGLDAKVGTLAAQTINNVTNIYFASSSATGQASGSATGSYLAGSSAGSLLNGFANIASFSSYLAYVPELQTRTATVMQDFTVYGSTTLSDVNVAGQLAIGGQMILTATGINVLGEDLQLQPLRQGGISFVGGQIRIDTDGNLMVNGKAVFNDTLAAKVITPLADQDLSVILGNKATPESGASLDQNDSSQKLLIKNASNSAILSINNQGDILASGAGTFAKLNLSLVQPAYAVSNIEVVASGSAGTTQINIHQKEVTIDTPLVTEKSLIYITPVGNTGGQVPFLLRQVPGQSFTVGVPNFTLSPIQVNWLIVN